MTGSIHGVLNLDWNSVMKVIRHAGVDSRMIILDDFLYAAMFRPSRASSGIQPVYLTKPVMGETLH